MSCAIVLGAQWGDEGKGKIVDYLAERAEVVVRFQGGANAGHTIWVEGVKVVLHLVPSGILRPGCLNLIGNGCVVDIIALAEEITMLREAGVDVGPHNLALSPGAHMVTPMHRCLDAVEGGKIGTTGRGIGPAYADKARRVGIRMESLVDGSFDDVFGTLAARYAELLPGERFEVPRKAADSVAPLVQDIRPLIHNAVQAGARVLYEGAQGTLLDIDHGTWPFVTSSSTSIGGALTGTGVWVDLAARIGIVKAYTTRVGHGPFPTELDDEVGDRLRDIGREYGATTGRPRRCGWLDLHLLEETSQINGLTHIALTKLDCLHGLDEILVAVGRDATGAPEYEGLPGWQDDLAGITRWEDLPAAARNYIAFIEDHLGIPVAIVSTGRGRAQTMIREEPW